MTRVGGPGRSRYGLSSSTDDDRELKSVPKRGSVGSCPNCTYEHWRTRRYRVTVLTSCRESSTTGAGNRHHTGTRSPRSKCTRVASRCACLFQGYRRIEGTTVLEKRRYFREHYDNIRTERCGNRVGMLTCMALSSQPHSTLIMDVFFLHNEGYSTMCGHAIIALTKLAIETGLVKERNHHH